MPRKRPPSPFLWMVLGLGVTALAAEWMRFQFGTTLLFPVAAFGGAVTFRTTVSAYRARRSWRLHHEATRPEPVSMDASRTVGTKRLQESTWSTRTASRSASPRSTATTPPAPSHDVEDALLTALPAQPHDPLDEGDAVTAFDAEPVTHSRRTR